MSKTEEDYAAILRRRLERFGGDTESAEKKAKELAKQYEQLETKGALEETISQRKKRFDPPEVTEDNYFNTRMDIEDGLPEEEMRKDTLHVYGVDFMSNQQVMRYFAAHTPLHIEWINDSSCNVVFKDNEDVEAAIATLCITKSEEPIPKLKWREGVPVFVDGVQRKIYFRYASAKDVKLENTKGSDSKYYHYVREKKRQKGSKNRREKGGRNEKKPEKKKILLRKPIEKKNRRLRSEVSDEESEVSSSSSDEQAEEKKEEKPQESKPQEEVQKVEAAKAPEEKKSPQKPKGNGEESDEYGDLL